MDLFTGFVGKSCEEIQSTSTSPPSTPKYTSTSMSTPQATVPGAFKGSDHTRCECILCVLCNNCISPTVPDESGDTKV